MKVSFFLWELWWDRTSTVNNQIVRGMFIPNQCCLCLDAAESSGHFFIHCPWVGPLWCYFLSRFGVVWVQLTSVRSLLHCWQIQLCRCSNEIGRSIWKVIPTVVSWAVWEERNRRTFEDTSKTPRMIIDAILSKMYDWVFVGQSPEWSPFRS